MIFQHTWQKVLSDEKTQTRRRWNDEHADGEWGPSGILVDAGMCNGLKIDEGELKRIEVVFHDGGRVRWAVGKTYAVQPGRGLNSVGQIRVTAIRLEDVRRISAIDTLAEGFKTYADFIKTWVSMHDKDAMKAYPDGTWTEKPFGEQIELWLKWIDTRPDTFYQAWVIEFELVSKA